MAKKKNKVDSIEDLIHDKRNANTHSEYGMQRLEKGIQKMGLGRSILISDDNEIIAGNGVTETANNIGIKKVRVVETDGTEIIAVKRTDIKSGSKEFYEMALSDNIIAKENIVMDAEVTNAICEEYEIEEYKLDDGKVVDAEDDEFDVPDGGIETDIVVGDLFDIGEHRLLCGDCTDSDLIEKLMEGEKADMVFTDPPYNVDYGSSNNPRHKSRSILNDKKTDKDWDEFVRGYMTNLLLFTNGNLYISMSDKELGHMQLMFEECGGRWASFIIWVKDRLVLSGKDYHSRHETILYGWNDKIENRLRVEDRKQDDVWEIKRPSNSELHPTMKPVELVSRMLNNSSKKGMRVLDLFLGSGTTMVASHQLNRKCYGTELDPKYCQVIINRMLELDPSLKLKRNGKAYKQKG